MRHYGYDVLMTTAVLLRSGMIRNGHVPFCRAAERATSLLTLIIAAAEVMLYWAKGNLPGLGTSLVDADVTSSTSSTQQQTGSMRQLGQKKRQKYQSNSANNRLEDVETSSSGGAS